MALGAAALGAAAIGAAGQAGLFGGPKQYGFSKGDIDAEMAARNSQINDFQNQLASMRAQYLAQIPGLQQQAFQRFGNDAAASFGSRGMETGSGAFQSALAREAIPMQAQMIGTGYETGINNLNAVNAARGQAFGSAMGVMGAGLSAPTQNPAWAALGNFAGQAGLMYLNNMSHQPGQTPPTNTTQIPQYSPGQGMPPWRS